MTSQFARFLLTGGVAAIVNLGSRYLFNRAVSFEVAVFLAYLTGMTTAYVLARLLVFDASGRSIASELGRFAVVNLFALGFVWFISIGFARVVFPALAFTWYADDIAHLIGVLAPALTSFLGHRFYTFARRPT